MFIKPLKMVHKNNNFFVQIFKIYVFIVKFKLNN